MKRKLRETKVLFAALFLITIFGIVTTVSACGSNRIFFMAKGDDLDINATDIIIGKIKKDEGGDPSSVRAIFHQRIYDESGKKVYTMMGTFKGSLEQIDYSFFCPIFGVLFIHVWQFIGEGKYKTTDTYLPLIYRNLFPITMPNTEGKYVSAPMVMLLSPTGEYVGDPMADPPEGGWVLTGVFCGIIVQPPIGPPTPLPIGPVSYLTRYIER